MTQSVRAYLERVPKPVVATSSYSTAAAGECSSVGMARRAGSNAAADEGGRGEGQARAATPNCRDQSGATCHVAAPHLRLFFLSPPPLLSASRPPPAFFLRTRAVDSLWGRMTPEECWGGRGERRGAGLRLARSVRRAARGGVALAATLHSPLRYLPVGTVPRLLIQRF